MSQALPTALSLERSAPGSGPGAPSGGGGPPGGRPGAPAPARTYWNAAAGAPPGPAPAAGTPAALPRLKAPRACAAPGGAAAGGALPPAGGVAAAAGPPAAAAAALAPPTGASEASASSSTTSKPSSCKGLEGPAWNGARARAKWWIGDLCEVEGHAQGVGLSAEGHTTRLTAARETLRKPAVTAQAG